MRIVCEGCRAQLSTAPVRADAEALAAILAGMARRHQREHPECAGADTLAVEA